MKVLMVNATYGGVSGSGSAVELLSKELLSRGIQVALQTGNTSGYLPVPRFKSASFALIAKLRLKSKYDIIHVHSPKFSVAVGRRSRNVLTIHGDFITELQGSYGSVTSKLFDIWFRAERKKFEAITCVSPYWSKLRGWAYVPNGLDLEAINEIPPSDERYVLFVGRRDKIKGYEIFKEGIEKTRYPYRVLGVHKLVPRTEVIALMKSAYCLVLPSRQEGMPYVILEAFAAGCPVVATDLPALRSFGEGAIHFLVNRDAESVRMAVEEVVEDQTLWDELRENGLKKAKEYDIRRIAGQYVSIYEGVADSQGQYESSQIAVLRRGLSTCLQKGTLRGKQIAVPRMENPTKKIASRLGEMESGYGRYSETRR
jgi:glycosyltransferase involved in cell wall biosynthesis